ncbi:septum site-determining protein MinC [Candidatus Berkiella cookevillensis]|uniref:Probable septum site-determining protein MinC n=1 Tax=Candidatus Berkiella cookevillensis TaxID=437022 RepID=A0A0Q9Y9A9_9GAMM|nr:septum site-determining protein MinC [Candidatus Berkiella cookevillensis]MCS5707739.1 septum site-determining protein MinC [Candidatus Berkiella cookevillensis]
MTTDVTIKTSPALALKGSLFTLTAIQLYRFDLLEIANELDSKIKQAPNFFQNTPIVIDLQSLEIDSSTQVTELIALFKKKKLIPVGIRGASNRYKDLAIEAGLAILPEAKPAPKIAKTAKQSAPEEISEATPHTSIKADTIEVTEASNQTGSRLITAPVRSGQQIYAPGGDLVVLAPVSHGAELLAEGHIHVHGPLRGRALAGVNGDKTAIIYCKSLEAELVSIAGQYKIIEDLKESDLWKRSVCIKLVNDRLQVEAL